MNIKDIWNFLGLTQDRIGRRRFLIAFFSVQWGLPLVAALLMGLFYLVFGEDSPILFLPALVLFASLIFGLIVYIKICIRRVRDIGIAQNWWVLVLIPLINFFFFIYLSLEKSGAGRVGSFSLTNLTREQFKRFFSHEFSKPFVIICLGVIVAGTIHAGYVVSDLKRDIDIRIEDRRAELDVHYDAEEKFRSDIFRASEEGKCLEIIEKYGSESSKYPECRPLGSIDFNRLKRVVERKESGYEPIRPYIADTQYRELENIKNTSSFQLFFENFGFGWWGIIALVAVLFINILVLFYKLARIYILPVFRYGNTQAKSIKTNMQGMAPYQRYSLTLLAIIVLVVIATVLIF